MRRQWLFSQTFLTRWISHKRDKRKGSNAWKLLLGEWRVIFCLSVNCIYTQLSKWICNFTSDCNLISWWNPIQSGNKKCQTSDLLVLGICQIICLLDVLGSSSISSFCNSFQSDCFSVRPANANRGSFCLAPATIESQNLATW